MQIQQASEDTTKDKMIKNEIEKEWILLNNEITVRDKEGNFSLHKDKEAVKSYFLNWVNTRTRFFHKLEEKLDFLITKGYYVDFFQWYSLEDMKKVFKTAYDKKFRFQSYMAAFKFYESYAMKDESGELFLERYEDRIAVTALFLAKNRENRVEEALQYVETIINQEYQPATPTFLNAGKLKGGLLVSCYLDEIGDSLPSIGYAIDSAMYLSAVGGGVSFNFSKLRARTEAIKGVSGRASGVLPVMKIMEDTFSYANQLGQRPGAGAAYLNIFHADIEEFLDCKKINVDEKSRIKSLSIGVIIPDKFMELAEKDEPCYVFYPYTVFKAYGVHLDDMDLDNGTLYQELVENVSVKKKAVNARQLLIKLSQVQKESGYPYIFFKGNANANHTLKQLGSIQFSNLCTEVLQVSQVSEIRPYGEEDDINYGISCILGSVNIAPVMENKSIKETVRTAMYTLTAVSDETNVSRVPTIAKANKDLRSVGLGAMNLHGFLAKNQIMYESEEAREFADKFFMLMNYYSLVYSNEIAKERKSPFTGFEKSEYANGNYFDNYLKGYNTDFKFDEIKSLFEGIELPSISDWRALEESVREYGLYHAYRLAIAPNQSTSYIMNATASTMPIVDQIEVREYGDSTTYYPMPYLNDDNIFFYKSAYDMNQFRVMDMIATIQKHIDQGISCILHTNSKDNTRDIARYYIYAHKVGLKTLYYTRTRKSTVEDCVSCSA